MVDSVNEKVTSNNQLAGLGLRRVCSLVSGSK